MEGELIILGFLMLIGNMILLQMWNANWFKKENFKIEKNSIMAMNKLKLDKMRTELGLSRSKAAPADTSKSGLLSAVLPSIIEKLPAETVEGLIERFIPVGEEGEYDEGGGLEKMLLNFAAKNPAVVEGLLKGLSEGGTDGAQSEATPEYRAQV